MRRHARVHDPDRVGDEHRCAAGERSRNHGLDRGELLRRATSLQRSLLEEGPRELIPVVVYEVCNADAEQRRLESGVESDDAFPFDDAPRGVEGRGLRAFRFDLGARGEGNEGVTASVSLEAARSRAHVRQSHGQEASSCAGKRVGDIVALLGGCAGRDRLGGLGELLLRRARSLRHCEGGWARSSRGSDGRGGVPEELAGQVGKEEEVASRQLRYVKNR